MLILRIGQGVIDHFPIRRSEWINSWVMIGWAVVTAVDAKSSLTAAASPLHQLPWIAFFALLGTIRLIVLTINGTFPQYWYGRYSAHFRVAMSLFSTLAWLQIVLAVFQLTVVANEVVVYIGLMTSDALNTLSASAEARELDKGRKDAASRVVDTRQLAADLIHRTGAGGGSGHRIRPEEPADTHAG